MAGKDDRARFLFDNLFVAFPNLTVDPEFLERVLLAGTDRWLDARDAGRVRTMLDRANRAASVLFGTVEQVARVQRIRGRLSEATFVQRLLILIPEALSSQTIGLLSGVGLLSAENARVLRVVSGVYGTAFKPTRAEAGDVLLRVRRLLGVAFSNDVIGILRDAENEAIASYRQALLNTNRVTGARDLIDPTLGVVERENRGLSSRQAAEIKALREALARRISVMQAVALATPDAIAAIRTLRDGAALLQTLFLAAGQLVTTDIIAAALKVGSITPKQARIMQEIINYGPSAWRALAAARGADGVAQRLLFGLYGAVNQELLDALTVFRVITPLQREFLQPIVALGRSIALDAIERQPGKARKYRVLPGETPLQTYARTSRASDRDILRTLAKASRDATAEAVRLAELGGRANNVRSAQYRANAAELHKQMRLMYEAQGHLIIRGEQEAAQAAIEAMEDLNNRLFRGKRLKNIQNTVRASGRAGVDSYISRRENIVQLSARLYGNREALVGAVDKRINSGLLRGQSAQEIARDISKYLSPRIPGGQSYVSMRLARTEINNAFHFTSIRHTREMPWVRGYRWNLSGSHPSKPDVCNQYATEDHDGDGPGIFRKRGVPAKPHPNCLCYITTITMTSDEFNSAYKKGRFNAYLKQVQSSGVLDTPVLPAR